MRVLLRVVVSMSERSGAITVGELIEKLMLMDPNLPVGVQGYFGEFYAIDKFDIGVETATSESWNWRERVSEFSYCRFPVVDIGEAPD